MNRYITIYVILLALPSICHSSGESESESESEYAVGIGIGIDYGHSGIKIDRRFLNNYKIHAAVGSAPSIGINYEFLKGLFNYNSSYSPRIGLTYGGVYHSEVSKAGHVNIDRYFYGYALVLGLNMQNKKRNRFLDIGFIYHLSDGGGEDWTIKKISENYSVECCSALTDAVMHLNIGYNIRF